MQESSELRAVRMLFVGSFLLSSILLILLALSQNTKTHILASYISIVVLFAGTAYLGSSSIRRKKTLELFLLAAAVNLIIVPTETFLRIRGFRYEPGVQFGYPRPYQFSAFEPHEKLFFIFPRSNPGVNSYGFDGPEPARPKPARTTRIIFLGNSCTWQGLPGGVEAILRGEHPEIECLNFATPGYSSHQGVVIARSYFEELHPDIVIACYGWNDRWLAYGAPDHEKILKTKNSSIGQFVQNIITRVRLLQLLRKALSPLLGKIEPLDMPRVPKDRFVGNLEEIGAIAGHLGARYVVVTEPSSYGSAGVPNYVVESGYARSKEEAQRLLIEYNDAIRAVARKHPEWYLLDLDSLISTRSDARAMFAWDGIHYSKAGLTAASEAEARFLRENILARDASKKH